VEYLGDYDYFVEKKLEQQELDAENGTPQTITHPSSKRTNEDDKELRRQERRLTRAIDELETRMSVLDEEMAALQAELSMPEFADDHVKLMELQAQIDERQEEHDCKSEEWLLLQEQLEAL
jgi:ATP-binding cassette, subfamily F, member 3